MATIRPRTGAPQRSQSLQRLAIALGDLHRRGGRPSTRVIARQTSISHDTVHRVLRCETVPQWSAVEAVTQALNGDPRQIRELWEACKKPSRLLDHPPEVPFERPSSVAPIRQQPGERIVRDADPIRDLAERPGPAQQAAADETLLEEQGRRRGHEAGFVPDGQPNRRGHRGAMDTLSRSDPLRTPRTFLFMITPEERDRMLALGVTRQLPPGRRILTEGRLDTHVEIIRQGYVKVTASVGGVPRLMAILLPGDLVGEMGALTGSPRSATVTAVGEVVSTVIRQADFLQFLGRNPHVAAQITATVAGRLRWSNERRSDVSAFPVYVRLARVLSDIAVSTGEAIDDGLLINVDLSQFELAALIGASPETVQRALRTLRARGLLRTGYRRIVVMDEAGLRRLAETEEWL